MFGFSFKRKATAGVESSVDRLTNILIENQDRLTIDRDGVISLNLDNEKVRREMKRQFQHLAKVEPAKAR
ncbi:TPA: hypothetical protein PIP05_004531 [Klebsiella oxytoca]|jgi:hypothetical protein|uniref:hypothetical protein n=1 Tax=Enterobacteriaceae TaxID=543 RepID=UPI0018C7996A|nr:MULTISPECIES: hypothetical protein [Klebsiella]MBG2654308.1 hypothetical protein [Klebsiella oxytoca]MDD9662541.1 hypothetical protein [Klebsiella pasteurii]MDD9670185.1 hypothetical protein [Klebsiella pasteurii]MDD9685537.1 hypothetical protein [Klebsiella pasteurii]MEB8292362.1 hypothetical protein [Klebsiella michiganensis]